MKTVIVIGSGVMGRGIAYVSAVGGFDTMIIDVNKQVLENAKNEITMIFNKSVSRGKLTQQHAEEAQSRLSYVTNLEDVAKKADLIIEAVPEKQEIKRAVFEKMEELASETCLFANNTSTMSPTEIASYVKTS